MFNMRLILMRHAASESNSSNDFNRILSAIGHKQAEEAALFLKNYQIDKVLVSYVKRTMQTLNLIIPHIPPVEIEMVTEPYEGTEENIVDLISYQEDIHKHILLLGHNPQLYNLVLSMIYKDDIYYDEILHGSLSPAQIVIVDFPKLNDWKDIRKHKGKITNIFIPQSN
ncbi:MAG: histidine phosphatase family protein [Rickettsiaceae bacterium]|nr:histidine phosphatase family protein [Rickettsiaceae bacterium]